MDNTARAFGRVYTEANPFQLAAFQHWAVAAGIPQKPVLEPFAGANNIVRHLEALNLCNAYSAFDITPASSDVLQQDTFTNFPTGFDVCITNPPWLAKNSATSRGLAYPDCAYDDLYKFSLSRCLSHCDYIAALVPEAFIRSGLFQDRLSDFISIRSHLFSDTKHPTGLALFTPDATDTIHLWANNRPIGEYHNLKARYLPDNAPTDNTIRFNAKDGDLGLIAFDNVREASIRCCSIDEIKAYDIKSTSRFITRIWTENNPSISALNECLQQIRETTSDVFLSSYRGLRKDGLYRRRLDWDLARRMICHVA